MPRRPILLALSIAAADGRGRAPVSSGTQLGSRPGRAVGQPAPEIVGTPSTASRSTCRPRRQAGRRQFLGADLRAVSRRVPAARGEAGRARRRRTGDRRRPDRRPARTGRDFVAEYGATWPTVIDPDKALKSAYRVVARPQTYFVDGPGSSAPSRSASSPTPTSIASTRGSRRDAGDPRSSSTGWSSGTAADRPRRRLADGPSRRARRAARSERRGQDDDRRDHRGLPPRRRRDASGSSAPIRGRADRRSGPGSG